MINVVHCGKFLVVILLLSCNFYSIAQSSYTEEVVSFRNEMVESALDYEEDPPLTMDDTANLSYFPIQEEWKIQAEFHPLEIDTFIKMPTTAGTEKVFKVLGTAIIQLEDQHDSLLVYQPFRAGLQPYLFIPFKDETSGLSTYGGGRYLEGPLNLISEDKEEITLDFNKAYNPWCAYSDGYFCPLPPPENNLSFKITAGEKQFAPNGSN